MKLFKKGQGATEYLLMLAAVLVIVAIAVYYVTSTGGYPAVAVTAVKSDNYIRINVETGSIPSGDWQYAIKNEDGNWLASAGGAFTETSEKWISGSPELKAPYVSVGEFAADNYWVSLKHGPSGHIYFSETKLTI